MEEGRDRRVAMHEVRPRAGAGRSEDAADSSGGCDAASCVEGVVGGDESASRSHEGNDATGDVAGRMSGAGYHRWLRRVYDRPVPRVAVYSTLKPPCEEGYEGTEDMKRSVEDAEEDGESPVSERPATGAERVSVGPDALAVER